MVNFNFMKAMILRGDETEKVKVHTERKSKRKRVDCRINIVAEKEDKIYSIGVYVTKVRSLRIHLKEGEGWVVRSAINQDLRFKHPSPVS